MPRAPWVRMRKMHALTALLPILFPSIASATCVWTVTGALTVADNLFASGTTAQARGLRDVRVKVWATTQSADIWTSWGEATTNSAGQYWVAVIPSQSGASGCTRSRRIKVKAFLDGPTARVSRDLITDYDFEVNNFDTWHANSDVNGRTVTLNKNLNTTTDPTNSSVAYRDTRAAQLYLGYRKIHLQLEAWNLNPGKARLYWPAEAGFSPPGGWVHINRNWFRYQDSSGAWQISSDGGLDTGRWRWVQRELTHELLHQWFYRNVYTPSFVGGASLSTHDFLESPALTLFEEAAEVQAIHVNEAVFGIVDPTKGVQVRSRPGIRCSFESVRRPSGSYYFTLSEVAQLIDSDSAEWRDLLDRANVSVASYLALLHEPNWFLMDFDLARTGGSGCQLLPTIIPSPATLCTGLPSPMFTIAEAMGAMKNWRNLYSDDRIPDSQRSLKEYYDYLSAAFPYRFGAYKEKFLRFGNPAFQGVAGENGIDSCSTPFSLPLPLSPPPQFSL